jgi:hypothetical protein
MEVKIKKAGIRGSIFLSYEFEQTDLNVKSNIKTSSDAPIHDDLRAAFRTLIPHYAFACEEIKNKALVLKAIKDSELYLLDKETAPDDSFFKYRVYGFSIKENKGYETVEILGSKQLENMEEISFSSYPIDVTDTDYPFLNELNESIAVLKDEVLAYMQGKSAPKSQIDMFPEDEGDGFDFDDNDSFEKPKKALNDLKQNMKKNGMTMTVTTSED